MSSSNVPEPVVFDLDVAASARMRRALFKAAGERVTILSCASIALIGIANAAYNARFDGWRDPFVTVVIVFWCAYLVLIAARAFRHRVRPETAGAVAFDESGITIRRGGSNSLERRVPFRRIRWVLLTREAIAMYGIWSPYVIIPIEAVPDGGTQLLRFFEKHIVSQGMSQRSHQGVTTVSNSLWPLLARGL